MSVVTAGAASWKMCSLAGDVTLDNYRHPDWAVLASPAIMLFTRSSRALLPEVHAHRTAPANRVRRLSCFPPTGMTGVRCYGDARSPNPAMLFMSALVAGKYLESAYRASLGDLVRKAR